MALVLTLRFRAYQCGPRKSPGFKVSGGGCGGGAAGGGGVDSLAEFPSFLPKEVHQIKDPFARTLAQRIQRLPVQVGFSESCIMSSCVTPRVRRDANPVVLLHCFDSSCLEWRSAYPLLEDAGLETWAIDILGWGFSDLERRPPCNVASKRYHLYQLWKSYIKRPMTLVGPSLGAAVAIDFAVNFPEAVDKLVLINANVYAEGTGVLTKLPKLMAYAMASLLKSIPIRWYAKLLVFNGISLSKILDYTNVGRLHCLLPWWEDATVNFMLSGGYNVTGQIKHVKQKTLLICSEDDKIVNHKLAERLQNELPNASMLRVPGCGHMPHIEKPYLIAKLITDFARETTWEDRPLSYVVDRISCTHKHIV
ncbi:putative hydrolase/acyltransferase (alpha/beta hydrolase superfamily) [Handroanthus impetiginosus]|uniref:Putative hydrolase/acyltransferase (Alpha/beta hydrolase superfamily) n=1 Tax=Handroanthus impetiginosus TaxID=429701 RepID=A0A2G9G0E2_9LAMI|nr:putative hydrolase/acyltransferase (alpha/beta hydrolase superfamily) [Handroanthus impetiginosus]